MAIANHADCSPLRVLRTVPRAEEDISSTVRTIRVALQEGMSYLCTRFRCFTSIYKTRLCQFLHTVLKYPN